VAAEQRSPRILPSGATDSRTHCMNRFRRGRLATGLATILGAAGALATACQSDELLERNAAAGLNGGFEITESGYPVNWSFFPNPEADSTLQVVLDSSEVVEGSQSLRIVVRPSGRLPALRSTQVAVQPGERYRLGMSFMNQGCSLKVNRIVLDPSGMTVRRRDLIIDTSIPSTAWETFEETLSVAQNEAQVMLVIMIGGSGTVWLDDVKVER
jgi:hypothetical protein